VESIAVIDIDPSLGFFKPNCILITMPVRIEMGFESRVTFLNAQRSEIQLQNNHTHARPIFTDWLLWKE